MSISTSILGKVRYNIRGEYLTSESYFDGDIVTYAGSQYLCKTNNSSGNSIPGLASATVWEKQSGLTFDRGEWSPFESYQVNDIVTLTTEYPYNNIYKYYDKQVYICVVANDDENPSTTPNKWKLLSSGSSYSKNAFLYGMNEGYSPVYSHIWDAKSQAALGTINTISVNTVGSGLNTTSSINGKRGFNTGLLRLTATGAGGTGFEGVAYVSAAGTCFGAEIINPGTGYTFAPTISIDTTVTGYNSGGVLPTFVSIATTVSTGSTGNTALCGMGDSVGSVKPVGTHDCGIQKFTYVNRRHQLVNFGANNNGSGGTPTASYTSADANLGDQTITEAQFICLDYLEGILPTPDGDYPKIIQVEGSIDGTLVLFNNGEVHYTGANGQGQSGANYTTTPTGHFLRCGYSNINKSGTSILRGKKAIRIASSAGGSTSASISNYALIENRDGTRELWSWGNNTYGQLGINNTTNQSNPQLVSFDQNANGKIVEIWATGGDFATLYVLTNGGLLFACGYNVNGQIGDGTVTNRSVLTRVLNDDMGILTGSSGKVKKFSINGNGQFGFCFLIRGNNSLYSWGYNAFGALGHNHTNNVRLPISVFNGGYTGATNPVSSLATRGTGQNGAITDAVDVWSMGGASYQFTFLTKGTSIISNTLFSCGYNGHYNLGDNTTTQRNIFVNVKANNDENLTNVMDCVSNNGQSSTQISCGIYRYNSSWASISKENDGEWYFQGYHAGLFSTGTITATNSDQETDPNFLASNFRYKNNIKWPYANRGNWKIMIQGQTTSKTLMAFDLNTGVGYYSMSDGSSNYARSVILGTPSTRANVNPSIFRRIRHIHM
jgi:alpha-tubulin suppressor-like RCC1 family protein